MLPKMTLLPWKTISSNYGECAIIGNGASVAVADTLSYQSLYDAAMNLNQLDAPQQSIFEFFKTRDFEFVLRALSHANAINGHLEIHETATANTYGQIKNALIGTVKVVHPDHNDTKHHFPAISTFLSQFSTVFSLNYDLLVYWAIMAANDSAGGNLFKDCFKGDGHFEPNYDYLRRPQGSLATATLLFYPHGNLALATDMWGTETKIIHTTDDLLNAITASWTLGGSTPLFVSEGDSDNKLRSIRRNSYLNQVYTELCVHRDSVLVYGWSFGQQDSHILVALARARVSRFGVSVHTDRGDPDHFCYEVSRAIHHTRGLETAHIDFFDSSETGVWVHT